MNFEIRTTARFERSAKALKKRHRSLKTDLQALVESLEKNPMQGVEIAPGLRKIRLTITSKGREKSGGARVITYTVFAKEDAGRVYLLEIYDKSDFSTVNAALFKDILSELS